MTRKGFFTASSAVAALFTATAPSSVYGQGEKTIDVPAQPLAQAIVELSEESGLRVVASDRLLEGKASPGAQGVMTPAEALQSILKGSGLQARALDRSGVMVIAQQFSEGGVVEVDEILVTGERTARSIQDTASSVDVTTAEDFEERASSNDLRTVFSRTANVNPTGAAGGVTPTIRGVSTGGEAGSFASAITGGLPRTTIQVDGRPQSYFELTNGDTSL